MPASFSAFPNPANEGSPVTFTGLFTDTSILTPEAVASIHWDFGDGISTSGILTPTHTYLDNGIYTPTLVVTGTTYAVGSATLALTINNVAPQVNAGPDQEGIAGQSINFTGTYTEPGALDTPTVLWDFGDTLRLPVRLLPRIAFPVPEYKRLLLQ